MALYEPLVRDPVERIEAAGESFEKMRKACVSLEAALEEWQVDAKRWEQHVARAHKLTLLNLALMLLWLAIATYVTVVQP